MDDRPTHWWNTNYRLMVYLVVLGAVIILVTREGSSTSAPPVAMAPATPYTGLTTPSASQPSRAAVTGAAASKASTRPTSPFDISDKPVGAWHLTDSGVGIQLQIRDWKAASALAVIYVSAGRTSSTAIYEGRVTQRTHTSTAFSVVEESSTTLPGTYSWCRRLSGTITATIRSGVGNMDLTPVCTDGTGRGIINHVTGGPINSTIPSILLDSGARVMHLGHAPG